MQIEKYDQETEFPLINISEILNDYLTLVIRSVGKDEIENQFMDNIIKLKNIFKTYFDTKNKLLEIEPGFFEKFHPFMITEFCAGEYLYKVDITNGHDLFDIVSELKIGWQDILGWGAYKNVVRILLFMSIDDIADKHGYVFNEQRAYQILKINYEIICDDIESMTEEILSYYRQKTKN